MRTKGSAMDRNGQLDESMTRRSRSALATDAPCEIRPCTSRNLQLEDATGDGQPPVHRLHITGA
jgi:hypothetical protein